jgi:hypothetical protein
VFFRFPVGTVLGVPERAAGDGVEDVGPLALDGDVDRIAGADHSLGREEGAQCRAGRAVDGQLRARRGDRWSVHRDGDHVLPPGELGMRRHRIEGDRVRVVAIRRGLTHVLGSEPEHYFPTDVIAKRRRDRSPQWQRPVAHRKAGLPGGGHQPGGKQPDRWGADEPGYVQIHRSPVQLHRPAHLDHGALVQQRDSVSDREALRRVVGDVEGGDSERADGADDLLPHPGPLRGVEAGERFVQQEDVRHLHQRAPHAHQATLAVGQLARPAGQQPAQPQLPGTAADPLLHFGLRQPLRSQSPPEIARHVEEGQQRRGFEDHRRPSLTGWQCGDVATLDDHFAGADRVQAGDDAQERGLAAAGRTQHDQQLAVGRPQRHVPQHWRAVPGDGHPLDTRAGHRPHHPRRRPSNPSLKR